VGGIVAGVAVGVATASIAAAEHVASQAKEIDKLSQSYGLSVQQISAFRVASTITGVSLDTSPQGCRASRRMRRRLLKRLAVTPAKALRQRSTPCIFRSPIRTASSCR
jgi:hypothetical protein